jgi:hypothetical protein
VAQVLREQIRVTRPGGVVSAVACFCHTDGLPHYHGRYPLPGNSRIDDLAYKLWQVFRRAVRPRLLNADLSIVNQELLWEFKAAGLEDVQINGHLMLVSSGDARISEEEAVRYVLARHEIDRERLAEWQKEYGDELAEAGFSQAEFDELLELKRARDEYLKADPSRVREVMEVYTEAFLIVRGTKKERI